MALDCFTRIFGTSRNKATRRRQPRRDYCFVELQERNKNYAHRVNFGVRWPAQRDTASDPMTRILSLLNQAPSPLRSAGALQKLTTPLKLGYLRDNSTKFAKTMFLV